MLDIEAIFSADVKPSNSQKTAMEENRKVQLTLTHDELKNGEEYLVVHESTERDGKYDVLLVTAENNSITLSLQDLSPISVAKLSVESVTALAAGATEGAPSPAGEAVVTESGNTNLIFAIILIVLIAGGALALVFFMKQRQKNGGGFNFHRA